MLGLVFYQTARGNCPVREFINALDGDARARVLEGLVSFREEFPRITTVDCRSLGTGLHEIRVRDLRGRQHRVVYSIVGGNLLVLHAFTKKTRKTPDTVLALARRRLREMTT